MKITKEWLEKYLTPEICKGSLLWFEKQNETDILKLALKAAKEGKYDYLQWAITRIIVSKYGIASCQEYMIKCAERVLSILKDDKNCSKAILLVRDYLIEPTEEKRNALKIIDETISEFGHLLGGNTTSEGSAVLTISYLVYSIYSFGDPDPAKNGWKPSQAEKESFIASYAGEVLRRTIAAILKQKEEEIILNEITDTIAMTWIKNDRA